MMDADLVSLNTMRPRQDQGKRRKPLVRKDLLKKTSSPKNLPAEKAASSVKDTFAKRPVDKFPSVKRPAARGEVVRAKGTDDVKFPDQDDILELSVTGDSSLFAWAKHFTSMSGIKPLWSKVQTFTEFSGSGCAEVALQSVAHHLGLSGDAVKVGHAADIDPACRRVLLNSLPDDSCVFGDILDLLPDAVKTAADEPVIERVYISKLELLRALSVDCQDDDLLLASSKLILKAGCGKLFTKGGVLRRPLGEAHKGWTLRDFDAAKFDEFCERLNNRARFQLCFCRRKTYDELKEIIMSSTVILKSHTHCYRHNKECMRFPTTFGDALKLMLLGSPCVDWTGWGDQLGLEGKTMKAFLTAAKLLARGDVDAIVHENVQNFPEKLLIDNLSTSYNPAGVCLLDPREVANFPIARQRKYVLMLKKGLELTRPLDNIVQTLSMNMSKQSSSSWKSLLLPLDVTHACNASLQSRLNRYRELFPGMTLCDLYQNPDTRPRKGHDHWPALTTGCSRVWLEPQGRFAHGSELLLLHSIPCTLEAARLMKCSLVKVQGCTHRELCKLAGNSMHSASVGLMCSVVLSYSKRQG